MVSYLDSMSIAIPPLEADAPLVVDSDAVLACPVASELLQPVPRRDGEVQEAIGCVKDEELAQGRPEDLRGQSAGPLAPEERLRVGIGKAPDHQRRS